MNGTQPDKLEPGGRPTERDLEAANAHKAKEEPYQKAECRGAVGQGRICCRRIEDKERQQIAQHDCGPADRSLRVDPEPVRHSCVRGQFKLPGHFSGPEATFADSESPSSFIVAWARIHTIRK